MGSASFLGRRVSPFCASTSAKEIESDFLEFVTSSEVDAEGNAKRRSAAAALVDEVSDLEDRQLCAMDIVRVSTRVAEKRLLPHLALSVDEANEMIYEARLSSDAGNHRQFYQVRARRVWRGGDAERATVSVADTRTPPPRRSRSPSPPPSPPLVLPPQYNHCFKRAVTNV